MTEKEQLQKWMKENHEETTRKCVYCKEDFTSYFEYDTVCVDCENELADLIESKGYVVGEFDCFSSPDYVERPFIGTKFDI